MNRGKGRSPTSDYTMHLLSLRFADEEIERRYASEHWERALPTIRIFLVSALVLYAAFGILDPLILPDIKSIAWTIRYSVVCPVFAGLVAFTYSPLFKRLSQPTLLTAMLASGGGIIVMVALAAPPGNSLYYAGLILVMIYGSSLIHLRWINAAACCLVLMSLYQTVAVLINPLPLQVLLNNDFFLTTSGLVAVFFSYLQELQVRRDFISTELIRRGKAVSDELRFHAEAANKAKSDFLAVMSHELRTPLNAIMGFSEVMQQRMFGPLGSEKYATYVDDIRETAEHLLSLITDILDLSRAEIGKLELREEEVDIVSILEQGLRLMRDKANEHGLRIVLQSSLSGRPVLRADARLLRQVFLNLLANAIKFTPSGGVVTVSIAVDPERVCCMYFSDTGIGIKAADVPRVLEPFVQVESALSRKHGGAGLGLPLTKKIMELHGGEIAIDSTPGIGTTVTLRFPAGRHLGWAVAPAVVA